MWDNSFGAFSRGVQGWDEQDQTLVHMHKEVCSAPHACMMFIRLLTWMHDMHMCSHTTGRGCTCGSRRTLTIHSKSSLCPRHL